MEEVFLKVRDENQESIQQRYIYNIIKANWCVSTFPTNQLYVVKAKGYVSTTLRVYWLSDNAYNNDCILCIQLLDTYYL